tara:strand:- start:641 stop:1189 length:549 start_codon:yes stop_codon:yes gene_type:complete
MTEKNKATEEKLESKIEVLESESAASEDNSSSIDDFEKTRQERDEYQDLLLRKTAEFDNYRKRITRERISLNQIATADLIAQLLPIIDDLERALSVEGDKESSSAYKAGVELIHKQLLELLAKHEVSPINTDGCIFDPHFHEAVTYELSEELKDGQIIEEIRKGYMIGERLLRPTIVKVAKS